MDERALTWEAVEILEALRAAVSDCSAAGKQVSLDNVYVDQIVGWPSAIGCFWDQDRGGWMEYSVGDRFELYASGPYSRDGVICALATSMFIPHEFIRQKFTPEEYDLYLKGQRLITR